MKQGHFWVPDVSDQGITCPLWNPEFHCRIQTNPPLCLILSQLSIITWRRIFKFILILCSPRVVTGEKNSPTVAHACRKMRLKWVLGAWGCNWATQSPGVINMETWSSRLELEHRASNPVSIKNLNATETSATESCWGPMLQWERRRLVSK
jgi:hypothetical protein